MNSWISAQSERYIGEDAYGRPIDTKDLVECWDANFEHSTKMCKLHKIPSSWDLCVGCNAKRGFTHTSRDPRRYLVRLTKKGVDNERSE